MMIMMMMGMSSKHLQFNHNPNLLAILKKVHKISLERSDMTVFQFISSKNQ